MRRQLVVQFVVVEEGERPHPFDVETTDVIDVDDAGRPNGRGENEAVTRVLRAIRREAVKP